MAHFFIPKLSVKMLCTDPYEMLSSSESSRIVIRLSEQTNFATFCTFSSVFEADVRHDRCSSSTDSFPLLNRSSYL